MTNPPATGDHLRRHYRDATRFNARVQLHVRFSVNKQGWQRWVFDQVTWPTTGRVLELGCGPGYLWAANRGRLPAGLALLLTDFSPGMLAETRRVLAWTGHPFAYAAANAQSIPLADATCAVVIANYMLYHVPDRAAALAEIRRVLRPGGCLYASTLGGGHMAEVRALLRRFQHGAGYDHYFLRGIGFNLETGADELAPWFPSVRLRRYDDALVVTEAAPLVAYIRSLLPLPEGVPGDPRSDLTAFIQQELDTHGPLHISTDTGLFIAGPGAAP
jgi:ubiquinone/menaquinone biosynthesis C-methylase UbiE